MRVYEIERKLRKKVDEIRLEFIYWDYFMQNDYKSSRDLTKNHESEENW